MTPITWFLKQVAVYWEPDRVNDDGQLSYKPPVEIRCRWEDKREQFLDQFGRNQVSNAIVHTDRKLSTGGVLWLGDMQDIVSQVDPFKNIGAYEVRRFCVIPDISGKKAVFEAVL